MVAEMGAHWVILYTDSQLVAQQVKGEYLAKDARMMLYLKRVAEVRNKF